MLIFCRGSFSARDGTLPGIFWAPLPGPDFRIVGMRTLVYHEAVPGHHFQIALQQENHGLPRYRQDRVFNIGSAFVEGWALYAEQLAAAQPVQTQTTIEHHYHIDAKPGLAHQYAMDVAVQTSTRVGDKLAAYGIN